MELAAAPKPTTSQFFSDEDADIIICADDRVNFRLYKVILAKASPVFEGMLSLPQTPPQTDGEESPDWIAGKPVLPLSEDSHTLETLFRLCYPVEHPQLTQLVEVHRVLEAARKYQMDAIADRVRVTWLALAEDDPLRAFALASTRYWGEEARIAARFALAKPVWPLEALALPNEFKGIPAGTAVQLISYHRKCGEAISIRLNNQAWSTQLYDSSACPHCLGKDAGSSISLKLKDWYTSYLKRVLPALIAQPAPTTVTDPALFQESLAHTFGSLHCDTPSHHIERSRQITQSLATELERVLAEVVLDLEF
ncbi:hypothetical protein PHLCEN_2v7095 [Hermanssonia centrifuga]|uniref:BTB domain-containing protein n=1 Tax=Hermanssonia centrifuga TaxID=98765 RepID=A0A2R6NXH3_9APHY|nr:hypothetical protein PHLCEN_2v7095 [Hermanssonia centrifuga]